MENDTDLSLDLEEERTQVQVDGFEGLDGPLGVQADQVAGAQVHQLPGFALVRRCGAGLQDEHRQPCVLAEVEREGGFVLVGGLEGDGRQDQTESGHGLESVGLSAGARHEPVADVGRLRGLVSVGSVVVVGRLAGVGVGLAAGVESGAHTPHQTVDHPFVFEVVGRPRSARRPVVRALVVVVVRVFVAAGVRVFGVAGATLVGVRLVARVLVVAV